MQLYRQKTVQLRQISSAVQSAVMFPLWWSVRYNLRYCFCTLHSGNGLDKLIQKIELSDQKEEEPFSTFIKGLAVDSRIDLETAKIIIEKYKKEKEN